MDRLWNSSEVPDNILQFIISDELSESYGASLVARMPLRMLKIPCSIAVCDGGLDWQPTRALLHPISRDKSRIARLTENALNQRTDADGENAMEGGERRNGRFDYRFARRNFEIQTRGPSSVCPVCRCILTSVPLEIVDGDQLLLAGEVSILREVGSIIPMSDLITSTTMIESLMKNKIISGLAVATWALCEHADSLAGI